jgi:hypothetical protein
MHTFLNVLENYSLLSLTNAQMKGHHKFNISQFNIGNHRKFVHL